MAVSPSVVRKRDSVKKQSVSKKQSTASASASAPATASTSASYWRLLWLGLLFHLIYLGSIFDIHFKSPLIHNVEPVEPETVAPAKRLVLFVADGLRADCCFEMIPSSQVIHPELRREEEGKDGLVPRAPFLHSLIRRGEALWGISHTRVPTESRPGHIAMIGGFYEDPSAITRGWKSNPVDYDHVLRRASWAWSMGAPEIVELFTGPRVHFQHYAPEAIDFAQDGADLDRWAFARLRELFEEGASPEAADLAAKLRTPGAIIFVHLLGLDTNGHAHKPHSRHYRGNVEIVDSGVREAYAQIEAFYGDGQTAYLFTSDHGMADGGTHGDGDPDNTRCPLVVWGAMGQQKGAEEEMAGCLDPTSDPYSAGWGLPAPRCDCQQADLTPLMASLAGLAIPVNSEGRVPPAFLRRLEPAKRISLVKTNAKQLLASLQQREALRKAHEPWYVPPPLTVEAAQQEIEALGGAEEGAVLCDRILESIVYLQRYDQRFLQALVTLGYLGWMLYVAIRLLTDRYDTVSPQSPGTGWYGAATLGVGLAAWLWRKQAPLQFYLYAVFPLGFLGAILQRLPLLSFSLRGSILNLMALLAYGLGILGLAAAFHWRPMLSLLTVLHTLVAGMMHPAGGRVRVLWMLNGLVLASFPLLPVIKFAWREAHLLGVVAIVLVGAMLPCGSSLRGRVVRLATLLMAAALAVISDYRHAARLGLHPSAQAMAWALLLLGVARPLLAPFLQTASHLQAPLDRLADVFLSFAPAYTLLSIS